MKVIPNPDKDSDCRYLAVCLSEGFEFALDDDEIAQILFSMNGEGINSSYFMALDMPIIHLLYTWAQYLDYCNRRNSQLKEKAPNSGKPQYTVDPYTGEARQQ